MQGGEDGRIHVVFIHKATVVDIMKINRLGV